MTDNNDIYAIDAANAVAAVDGLDRYCSSYGKNCKNGKRKTHPSEADILTGDSSKSQILIGGISTRSFFWSLTQNP
ncbi:predicted protein [Sclerotinia sclerotiorum 1980 UF-70]|uniref:Uncharacterized protein n=1 Tax=Sclerotinia sclerotiorum (strain ATCC 18683 / 1980 / Ss-1) TaxID=665079 RepID=A7EH40_SCLS1|nr:predicted protein [Sclerotinia sclerotiorum 1980 UF-70]EDO02156.1 predicted protein [Sclerotinia sclerotiorum 1980 UF-70]